MTVRVWVLKAPGYCDEWEGTLLCSIRSVNGRPLSIIEYDAADNPYGEPPAVIASEYVRISQDSESAAPRYAECGCLVPCPDHTSGAEGGHDRAYWNDRPYGEGQEIVDHAERSAYDDDPSDYEG